jgi:hypothetical protein
MELNSSCPKQHHGIPDFVLLSAGKDAKSVADSLTKNITVLLSGIPRHLLKRDMLAEIHADIKQVRAFLTMGIQHLSGADYHKSGEMSGLAQVHLISGLAQVYIHAKTERK